MMNYSGRLFTFGCSFTQYQWPTWADILGREFTHYENWGKGGSGNHLIFYSLIECIQRNDITHDDTVVIMWSQCERENRYINKSWISCPNFDDKNFLIEYYDTRGIQLRNFLIIKAAKELLESKGINYKFLSIVPINNPMWDSIDQDLMEFFDDVIASIFIPSAFEFLFDGVWHATKYQSDFGEIISKEEQRKILKERYQAFAGARWPSFEDFLLDKIKDENREDIKKYSLFTLRDFAIRKDLHPVPTEHLLYLQKIYPDIKLSEETKKWVNEYKLFDQFDSHQPKIRL